MPLHIWKSIFMAKGLYNIVSVILAWMFTDFLFQLLAIDDGHNNFFFHLFLAHALIFGIGFVFVAFEVRRNHLMIITGSLAMFSLSVTAGLTWWWGQASWLILVPGVVDAACATLFLVFWLTYEWSSEQRQPD